MKRSVIVSLLLLGPVAQATPSTSFWAPATHYLQPFGVLHVTYDTYFGAGIYPVDVGLTIGVLPLEALQLEVGFDLFYPTVSGDEAMAFPIQLHAKVGTPEDVLFAGQPGWSAGIYGFGFEEDVNDHRILHAMIGKTLGPVGTFAIGGYYGLNADLLRSPEGEERRAGFMASWTSPAWDVPLVDKLALVADVQTGENALGGGGVGAGVYFTPAIVLLTGPVFYFESALQPGGSSWLWTVQLDVDVELVAR